MKIKKIISLSLCFLAFLILLAGCKIETPEQAARNAQITAEAATGQAEQPSVATGANPSQSQMAQATPSGTYAASDEYIDSQYVDSHYGSSKDKQDYSKYNGKETKKYDTSGKDQYRTDPVPSGKPQPVEWQNEKIDKSVVLHCTLSINCGTILNNMDKFNADKAEVLPKDGVILTERKAAFYKGESVFNVLLRETQKNRIQMEYVMTPIYNSNYIKGIHNLYEFDCGELSGWMYCVNGWYPNYGCSRYQLQDGDTVKWRYTCDLGRDLGVTWIRSNN